jgi:hypothetical protein
MAINIHPDISQSRNTDVSLRAKTADSSGATNKPLTTTEASREERRPNNERKTFLRSPEETQLSYNFIDKVTKLDYSSVDVAHRCDSWRAVSSNIWHRKLALQW